MNTKEAKLCYEIALLNRQHSINVARGIKEVNSSHKQREEKIEKLTDELICLGLDQYEE